MQSIIQREGLRGLYAGYGSFLLRDLPFDAIEFVAYEQLRKVYGASLGDKRSINGLETGAIGGFAAFNSDAAHPWLHWVVEKGGALRLHM